LGIFLFYKRHRTKVTQESVFIIKQAPIVIFISLGLIVVLAGISLNFNNQNAEMKQQLLDATNVVQRIESKIDDLTNFVSKAVSPRGTVIFNEKLLHKFIITNTPHNQYKYQTIEEFRSDLPRGFKRYHVHAVLIGYCTNAVRVQFFVKTSSIVDWHDGTGVQDGKEIKINGSDKSSDGVSTTEKEFTSMIDAEFTAYQIAPQIWIDVLQDSDKEKEVILSPETSLDTLSKSDTIVPFGLGCWLCSSNTLAPLLDVVRSKRGVLVFQPRVVFLTPEDEETWLPFPKSSLQNAEP